MDEHVDGTYHSLDKTTRARTALMSQGPAYCAVGSNLTGGLTSGRLGHQGYERHPTGKIHLPAETNSAQL